MRPVVLLSSNLFVCPPATSKNSEGSLEKCMQDARGISLNYWKNILKCKMLLFGKDSSHISCLSQFQFSKMGSKGRDNLLINLAHLSSVSKLFLTIRRAGNMRLLKFPIFRPVVTIQVRLSIRKGVCHHSRAAGRTTPTKIIHCRLEGIVRSRNS